MLKVLSSILCDLDPKVKVIGQKVGICDGVPSPSALVFHLYLSHAITSESDIMPYIKIDKPWAPMVYIFSNVM